MGIETQTDLGLDEPEPERPDPREVAVRTARLRGKESEDEEEAESRAILPDIDEVKASLAAATDRPEPPLADTEAEAVAKRRAGFRLGFSGMMILVTVLILLYLYASQIAAAIPSLEPTMAAFVDWANGMRQAIDSTLARSVESISSLTEGGNAAGE